MQSPPPPDDKTSDPRKETSASLAVRLNRAANELNPFLVVLAAGLFVLNLTLYVGLSIAREPMISTALHQIGGSATPANANSRYNADIPGIGPTRN